MAKALMYIASLWSTFVLAGSRGTTCEDAWVAFQGSCYFFGYEAPMVHTDAVHFCQQHNSNLVQVNDVHENNFLKDFMRRLKPHNYWLDLTDDIIEGEWRWSATNEIPTFTDWYPGEPDSALHTRNEDCVTSESSKSGADFRWHDVRCEDKYIPLCEKRSGDFEPIG